MCTDVQEPDVRKRRRTVPQPLRAARGDVRAADAPRSARRICLQRCASTVHAVCNYSGDDARALLPLETACKSNCNVRVHSKFTFSLRALRRRACGTCERVRRPASGAQRSHRARLRLPRGGLSIRLHLPAFRALGHLLPSAQREHHCHDNAHKRFALVYYCARYRASERLPFDDVAITRIDSLLVSSAFDD